MDLHANLNQFAAADAAKSLVFGQRMLHDFYRSPFRDHIVNAAGTALAGLLLFALFHGLHAVCIPGLGLIEQMGKLLHDDLVQLLRGAAKQLPLVQLQLLHQPAILQKGLGQFGSHFLILLSQLGGPGGQLLALLRQLGGFSIQLSLHRFVFRTGNGDHFPVTCLIHFCTFHNSIVP